MRFISFCRIECFETSSCIKKKKRTTSASLRENDQATSSRKKFGNDDDFIMCSEVEESDDEWETDNKAEEDEVEHYSLPMDFDESMWEIGVPPVQPPPVFGGAADPQHTLSEDATPFDFFCLFTCVFWLLVIN